MPAKIPGEDQSPGDPPASPLKRSGTSALRRTLPVLFALGLLAWVVMRIDSDQLVGALSQGDHLGLVLFTLAFVPALLMSDVAATRLAYKATICDIPYKELLLLRGASYLPSMVNHNVGQVWLTYFLSRAYKAPLWRMTGATLFVYATTMACVVLLGATSLPSASHRVGWLLPTISVLFALGLGYLLLLQLKPRFLARLQLLAPLFEMGPWGHLRHAAFRLPHVIVLFVGTWIPFHFFGIQIPFTTALVVIPLLMLIVAIPLTPQGVGTRDVVALQLLGLYVPEARESAIAAATLSFVGVLTLIEVVISLACLPRARSLLRRAD